jgi:hypothetical protein
MGLFSLSHSNFNREFGPPSFPSSRRWLEGIPGLMGVLYKSLTKNKAMNIIRKQIPVKSYFFNIYSK